MAKLSDFLGSENLTFGLNLTTSDIIIGLFLSLILGFFVFYIYKKTYSGVLYSKNFNVTLVITVLLVTAIMMAISGNLILSLGLVGSLSIIRFRTAIKDPKDLIFLLWSVAIGVINGARLYKLSVIASIFVAVILLFFSKRVFFGNPYVINLDCKKVDDTKLSNILDYYCKRFQIVNTVFLKDQKQLTIEVLIKPKQESELTSELMKLEGIIKVVMFSHKGELVE